MAVNADEQELQPRFWGLDPVFSTRVKLNIIDILSLKPHPIIPEVYCILNHPVTSVHIMGDVVSIQRKAKMIKYEVDDGTGVLSCTQWREVEDSDEGLFIPQLGQLVSVWGKLSEYRGAKQVSVTEIVEQTDPNAEVLHWLEVIRLKRTVYSSPFSLPQSLVSGSAAASSPRAVVRESVLSFLEKFHSGKHFTLLELSSSTDLAEHCRESVVSAGLTEQVVAQEIAPVVQKLAESGVIIPAVGVGRHRDTLYEMFSAKKHLFPVVLEYLKVKERTTESVGRLGVPEDWIMQYVQQRESLRKVSTAVISDGLREMVGESLIYLLGVKSYKSVT